MVSTGVLPLWECTKVAKFKCDTDFKCIVHTCTCSEQVIRLWSAFSFTVAWWRKVGWKCESHSSFERAEIQLVTSVNLIANI